MVTRRLSVPINPQMAQNNAHWHSVGLCDFTWPLWACLRNDMNVLGSTGFHLALKLLILCVLYNLSNHELQPAMWKQCLTTNLSNSWLPSWSTKVVHEGTERHFPKGKEINNVFSKAHLHQGWNPPQASEVIKSLGRSATVKGPLTRLGSRPVVNSDGFHVCNTFDTLSLTPVSTGHVKNIF